jgi:hypothetical protein
VNKLWFCLAVCVMNGLFTSSSYYFGASRLEHAYNVLQENNPEDWKCQPRRKLSPKLHAEAVRWSLVNSFLAGFVGTAIFMRHLNTGNLLKLYYDVNDHGWVGRFCDSSTAILHTHTHLLNQSINHHNPLFLSNRFDSSEMLCLSISGSIFGHTRYIDFFT